MYPLTESGIAQARIDLESGDDSPVPLSVTRVVTTRQARVLHGMDGATIAAARGRAIEHPAGSGDWWMVKD